MDLEFSHSYRKSPKIKILYTCSVKYKETIYEFYLMAGTGATLQFPLI